MTLSEIIFVSAAFIATMLFCTSMMLDKWRRYRLLFFVLIPLAFVGRMVHFHFIYDPPAYALQMRPFAINTGEELMKWGALTLLEAVVLSFIIRPWSFHDHWKRLILSIFLLIPYSVLFFVGSMHSSSMFGTHVLWLLNIMMAFVIILSSISLKRMIHTQRDFEAFVKKSDS